MLQQTRVDTVIPYYARFLDRFPTALHLADGPLDDVLAMWSGLGYYRRARMLHQGAQSLVARGGALPATRERLLDVPGIGRYTAGAIASIAFGEPVGLVDGNVARVLARLFAIEDDMRKAGMKRAQSIADAIVPPRDPGGFNQALMELGATVCTPSQPACKSCPVARSCRAHAEGRERTLPVLSAKTKPVAQRVQSLVVIRPKDGAVLLARRKPDQLFGGLWEPPSANGSARVRPVLASAFGVEVGARFGTVAHVLSHRKLTVDVLGGTPTAVPTKADLPEPYDAVRFVAPDHFGDLGIATLARKILARAGVVSEG